MKSIKLNNQEFNYLTSSNFLPNELNRMVRSSIEKYDHKYLLVISEEEVDILRDFFGEQLQMEGFDEGYELTKQGEILESLIDKFFV